MGTLSPKSVTRLGIWYQSNHFHTPSIVSADAVLKFYCNICSRMFVLAGFDTDVLIVSTNMMSSRV